MTIRTRLRALRAARGLSQEWTARLAGLATARYRQIECDPARASESERHRIACALTVRASALWTEGPGGGAEVATLPEIIDPESLDYQSRYATSKPGSVPWWPFPPFHRKLLGLTRVNVVPPNSRSLPILPDHGVHLLFNSGDGPRFVRLFRTTWGRLPLRVRRQIAQHWRRQDLASRAGVEQPPMIGMFRDCAELYQRADGSYRGIAAHGCETSFGFELYFNPSTVRAIPNEAVCDLIAHELAHVLDDAVQVSEALMRDPTEDPLRSLRPYDPILDEIDVTNLLLDWGFDDGSIGRCPAAQRRVTTVPV